MSLVDDETKAIATDEVIEDAMNKPVDEDEVVDETTVDDEELVDGADDSDQEESVADEEEPDIIDIDLTTPTVEKKKFRLNGDNTQIIELNVNDTSIVGRLSSVYKKLKTLYSKVEAIQTEQSEDEDLGDYFERINKELDALDDEMREQIDILFASNVSEVVAPKGKCCMYDPVNGMFRFEHIIETLSNLYANNLNKEFNRMRAKTDKHTSKYTKKKKKY